MVLTSYVCSMIAVGFPRIRNSLTISLIRSISCSMMENRTDLVHLYISFNRATSPLIPVSGLRISWAVLAAKVPTNSIFVVHFVVFLVLFVVLTTYIERVKIKLTLKIK